jgi:hypothetical protein
VRRALGAAAMWPVARQRAQNIRWALIAHRARSSRTGTCCRMFPRRAVAKQRRDAPVSKIRTGSETPAKVARIRIASPERAPPRANFSAAANRPRRRRRPCQPHPPPDRASSGPSHR